MNDQQKKVMQECCRQFSEQVFPVELLPYLPSLPLSNKERVMARYCNEGATSAAFLLHSHLQRWPIFNELLSALRQAGMEHVADLLDTRLNALVKQDGRNTNTYQATQGHNKTHSPVKTSGASRSIKSLDEDMTEIALQTIEHTSGANKEARLDLRSFKSLPRDTEKHPVTHLVQEAPRVGSLNRTFSLMTPWSDLTCGVRQIIQQFENGNPLKSSDDVASELKLNMAEVDGIKRKLLPGQSLTVTYIEHVHQKKILRLRDIYKLFDKFERLDIIGKLEMETGVKAPNDGNLSADCEDITGHQQCPRPCWKEQPCKDGHYWNATHVELFNNIKKNADVVEIEHEMRGRELVKFDPPPPYKSFDTGITRTNKKKTKNKNASKKTTADGVCGIQGHTVTNNPDSRDSTLNYTSDNSTATPSFTSPLIRTQEKSVSGEPNLEVVDVKSTSQHLHEAITVLNIPVNNISDEFKRDSKQRRQFKNNQTESNQSEGVEYNATNNPLQRKKHGDDLRYLQTSGTDTSEKSGYSAINTENKSDNSQCVENMMRLQLEMNFYENKIQTVENLSDLLRLNNSARSSSLGTTGCAESKVLETTGVVSEIYSDGNANSPVIPSLTNELNSIKKKATKQIFNNYLKGDYPPDVDADLGFEEDLNGSYDIPFDFEDNSAANQIETQES